MKMSLHGRACSELGKLEGNKFLHKIDWKQMSGTGFFGLVDLWTYKGTFYTD